MDSLAADEKMVHRRLPYGPDGPIFLLSFTANKVSAYTDEDKAGILARPYALLFSPKPTHLSLANDRVNNFLDTPPDPLPEIQPFVIHKLQ